MIMKSIETKLTDNFTVECLGEYESWVYDIEVEDNHNFFGNDILVHNSQYLTLKAVIDQYYDGDDDTLSKVDWLDNFIKTELDPVIEKCNKELSSVLNAYEGGAIQAEREAIADVGVMLSKKKYYMRVYDLEGVRYNADDPYMKKMGIEIIRSSTPKFVKDYLTESLNIILDSNSDTMYDWLENIKKKFTSVPIADISKTTGVSKINYNINDKGVPINSRAAIAHNDYILSNKELSNKYNIINAGDKIKFIYLKSNNPFNQNVIGYIDENFIEDFREYIDFDTCWDKFMVSPLNIMIAPLGWNMNKRTESLDEW